ncbi:hypothetical protein ASPVEDRAFT_142094 [Aspergillus versicolor CBS 583.65]|uniref:DUF3533 domain-containing protein n=1 Tax=Aspergillus versicolor CBS 583.65 TaxID=1036611 RepID=A0A1L9Q1L6_ASPVE|nr:uncharacterized protein ASPVEDRAFT_142094 [Aspergillus versicolor CBS 583.65]OJJ07651.1 hypothetical protein ASPVEDRAFT_142094 [Aspergillus versicolor CBS 583.65]
MTEKKDASTETPSPDTVTVKSVGFFDSGLKPTRKRVLIQWARTVSILCVFILGILSLFWASRLRVTENLYRLTVWVVDFDSPGSAKEPFVGPAIIDVATSLTGVGVGYSIQDPADFDYNPMAVRQRVYDQKAYAAIVINPNATSRLLDAVRYQIDYTPASAGQIITVSAREPDTFSNYLTPALDSFERQALLSFGPLWVHKLVSEFPNTTTWTGAAVSPAIGFQRVDLRPFTPAVAGPAVTIGLIYLIILAFFIFPFLMPVHSQLLTNATRLRLSHWIIWRIISNLVAYFFLSLFYSFVSLAFQIPFSNSSRPGTEPAANATPYSHGSFVVFWMLNWVGMAALGFPCENMAMVLGSPWSSFFLIFWVISNVATGFYSIDLAPGFFAWGYAWPIHRIVEALRTIIFGTHSRIGLDFGILFAWVAVSIAFFPFATHVMLWKMKRRR